MDKIKDACMSRAYMNGRNDYEIFGENVPNPYIKDTEDFKCWEAGYSDARSLQAIDEQDSLYA